MMRDIGQVFACFEVTQKGFAAALDKHRAALMVPGGQAEMLYSRSDTKEVRLNTRHKGFIRMAFTNGAHLVPLVAFGEMQLLDNVPIPAAIQRFFMNTFRANFCFLPYGLGFLPVPRPVPYRLVVGEPIPVPHIAHPTNEMIDAVHRQYYQAVQATFEAFKAQCDHADDVLVLEPDVPAISAAEWHHATAVMQAAHRAEDPAARRTRIAKVHALDMFRGKETVWVTCFMLLVFAIILIRAWPHVSGPAQLLGW